MTSDIPATSPGIRDPDTSRPDGIGTTGGTP
jgi:hypothetical protein